MWRKWRGERGTVVYLQEGRGKRGREERREGEGGRFTCTLVYHGRCGVPGTLVPVGTPS